MCKPMIAQAGGLCARRVLIIVVLLASAICLLVGSNFLGLSDALAVPSNLVNLKHNVSQTPIDKLSHALMNQRFIIVDVILEQMAKAEHHMKTMFWLAHALNRTMILPRYGNNQFGLNGALGFEDVYDMSKFQNLDCLSVKELQFLLQSQSQVPKLSAVPIRFSKSKPTERNPSLSAKKTLYFDGSPDGAFHLDLDLIEKNYINVWDRSPVIVQNLSAFSNVDVILIRYDGVFDPEHDCPKDLCGEFDFSDAFFEIARSFRSHYGDYIAAHWRSEGVRLKYEARCIEVFTQFIEDLMTEKNVSMFYFASDIDRNGMSQSASYRSSGKMMQAWRPWIQGIYSHFGERIIANDNMSHLIPPSSPFKSVLEKDPMSVRTIIDSVIMQTSTVFVSGLRQCVRPGSFTSKTIHWRERHSSDHRFKFEMQNLKWSIKGEK